MDSILSWDDNVRVKNGWNVNFNIILEIGSRDVNLIDNMSPVMGINYFF